MKFLLVEDGPIIRQFCTLVLENNFQECSIVECINSYDAIDILKKNNDIDFIISDFDMPGGNGDVLVDYLESVNWNKPYLFHTSNFLDDVPIVKKFVDASENRKYAQKPVKMAELTSIIRNLSGEKPNNVDFSKVRISYFLRSNKALCDIYIKLGKEKFVKIINGGEFYKKSDIDKYIEKDQKYLYLSKDDFEGFADGLRQTPFLEFVSDLNDDDPEESLVRIHAVLKDLVESAGVDKHVVGLAESYMNSVLTLTQSDQKLSDMLFKLRQRRDYIYDHSYMTACMATFIVKKMSWSTTEVIQKLCYASLFHDITITDPEIAMIHDLNSSEMRKFSKEELAKLSSHPKDACTLLANEKAFSQDVEYIILNHHENGDGTGFPRGLDGSSIRPVSCVFIIAHEFVRQLYNHDFDENSHKDILTVLFNSYNTGNFKDILDALYHTLSLNIAFEEN
ncbi:MAG: hypothetical protein BM556_12060 [Bacteriovorax sp. MedPE-SWde]|nr:MAG: hypothetical protein BM556_12060 [Bacteriovorax sp. MedPE-SWde]